MLSQINRNSSTPFIPSSDSPNKAESLLIFSEIVPVKWNKGCTFFIADSPIPFSIISFLTPSSPILSSLSKATVKSINLSLAPITSAIPERIFRLLILIVTPSNPNWVKTESYNCTNSTSCHKDFDPTTSASHWKNSLKRPFCGRSARQTGWIWYLLNGNSISLWCCTTYLANGTVKSYRKAFSEMLEVNLLLSLFCNKAASAFAK